MQSLCLLLSEVLRGAQLDSQGSFSAPQAELVMFKGYRRGVQGFGGVLSTAVLGGKLCAPDGITHDSGDLQARPTGTPNTLSGAAN